MQQSIEETSEQLESKKIQKYRKVFYLGFLQFLLVFVPMVETPFVRRSIYDFIRRIPFAIFNLDLNGIGQYYGSSNNEVGGLINLLAIAVAFWGLAFIVILILAYLFFAIRKLEKSVTFMKISQFFSLLMVLTGVGITIITIVINFADIGGASIIAFISSIVSVIIMNIISVVIMLMSFKNAIGLKKEYAFVGYKGLFKFSNKKSSIIYGILLVVFIITIMNANSLRKGYMYDSGIYYTSATIISNDDVESQYVFFVDDKDEFENIKDDIENSVDRMEDRLDEFDVNIDWSIKKSLFNKVTLNVTWEGVLDNKEFYDALYMYQSIGNFFTEQYIMGTAIASYEITEEDIDNENLKDEYIQRYQNVKSNDFMSKGDFRELEGAMILSSMPSLMTFDSMIPEYISSHRQERNFIELSSDFYFLEWGSSIIY